MCTVIEKAITCLHSDIARHLYVDSLLLALLRGKGFLTESEYHRFDNMTGKYITASKLIDYLKVFSSENWTEILEIFKEAETGQHIIDLIQKKCGMYTNHTKC
jgi:hypothetical protein